MLHVEQTVLVLLAAGRSKRFGDVGSKLDQEFLNRPLGVHVAVAFEAIPFLDRVAVVDGGQVDYRPFGFEIVANEDPARGMSTSVALGVAWAERRGAQAVLLALADMPRVTAAHVHRLFDVSAGPDSVIASSDGREPSPPALFGAARFAELKALTGDAGARAMVRAGRHVVTSPAELIDVDTPDDLDRLRALVDDPIRGATRRSG